MVFAFVCTFTTLVFPLLLIFLFLTGYAFISLICILFLEKACGEGQKKKQVLKFTLDCTHPVEDGIMDAANFVSYPLMPPWTVANPFGYC